MTVARVLVTRRVPEPVLKALTERFELDYHDAESTLPRADLLARAAGVDGIVSTLTDAVDAELLDAAGNQLAVFANYALGHDNIDGNALTDRSVTVTDSPDSHTDTTADLA